MRRTLEPGDDKQKNPNETGSLARIAVRDRPPRAAGSKTMAHGWQWPKAMAQGRKLRKDV